MASNLESVLDRLSLRRMAGARSFERGEEYFADGQVGALVEHEGTIAAKVQGTRSYRVKLWAENGELGFSCTCPVGADGAFCKHCVAAGLSWVEGRHPVTHGTSRWKPAVTMQAVRAHLTTLDKGALAGMLVEQAMEDDRLRERLLM